jgi:extracellular elastinolytic metalloproteinase
VTVDVLVGVGDINFANNLLLYPNPTSGAITLKNNTAAVLDSMVITDVKGRIIKNINLSEMGSEAVFSINDLATGLYFVRINAQNASVVKRVVKL